MQVILYKTLTFLEKLTHVNYSVS